MAIVAAPFAMAIGIAHPVTSATCFSISFLITLFSSKADFPRVLFKMYLELRAISAALTTPVVAAEIVALLRSTSGFSRMRRLYFSNPEEVPDTPPASNGLAIAIAMVGANSARLIAALSNTWPYSLFWNALATPPSSPPPYFSLCPASKP